MYALIENGVVKQYPYDFAQLKVSNPLTSFPSQATDSMLESFGVERVFFSTPPEISDTQVLVETTPIVIDNRWTQTWSVRDMTSDEVEYRNNTQATHVRTIRNAKLSETDWTQVADAPVDKSAWAIYRQSLRDITTQSGFPWEIIWPDTP